MEAYSGIITRVIWIVVLAALFWGVARFFEWRNLYAPVRTIAATPRIAGVEYEDVAFVAEDGVSLHGWWMPHEKARGTIIFCHGNAGNMGDRIWIAKDLLELEVNVFLFDYRGYGESRGIPTEKGTYRDVRAAYEVVRARYDQAEDPPVISYGRSLGGAVAVQLAIDKPVRGLIVESSFSSTEAIGEHLFPALPIKWFSRYKYDSVSKMPQIHVPVMIAHSHQDELIPQDLGRELFKAANEPKQFIELRGAHNESGWADTQIYWHAIDALITEVCGPRISSE